MYGLDRRGGKRRRVANPLEIEMYVSQENAAQLKTLQLSTLKTTTVSALNYLILDYDQEVKRWFTQAAPAQPPLSGILAGGTNPELNVDMTPVGVKDGVDVYVYKVTVQIAPAANTEYVLNLCQQRHHARDEILGPGGREHGLSGSRLPAAGPRPAPWRSPLLSPFPP